MTDISTLLAAALRIPEGDQAVLKYFQLRTDGTRAVELFDYLFPSLEGWLESASFEDQFQAGIFIAAVVDPTMRIRLRAVGHTSKLGD